MSPGRAIAPAHVSADVGGEPAGEIGVGQVGHQQQPPILGDRASEQRLAGGLVVEQALAQGVGAHTGTSSSTPSTRPAEAGR
jgi:hypothetical protein